MRHRHTHIPQWLGQGFLDEAHGATQLISTRVYSQKHVDVIRHNNIFTASYTLLRFTPHEGNKIFMEFIRCEDGTAVMRTNRNEVQRWIVFPEYGFQARWAACYLSVHDMKLAKDIIF